MIAEDSVTWTTQSQAVVDMTRALEDTDSAYFMRLQTNLVSEWEGEYVQLYVPHIGGKVEFEITQVRHQDENEYIGIYGQATGIVIDGDIGDQIDICRAFLVISASPTRMVGMVGFEDQAYSIQSISAKEIAMFSKMNLVDTLNCRYCDNVEMSNEYKKFLNGSSQAATPRFESGYSSTALSGGACIVDVVVASTVAARLEGEMQLEGFNVIFQANLALLFSNVTSFCYRYAGYVELQQFSYVDDTDRSIVINNANNHTEVQNIYTNYSPDQLMIIAQSQALEGVYGVSELLQAPATRDLVVIENGTRWRFTGAHELGHNHGCKHDVDNTVGGNGQLLASARGYVLPSTTVYHSVTIMSLTPNNHSRIIHFSNPAVNYNTVNNPATGTIDRDNAAQLQTTGCFVSDIRPSSFIGIIVDGPTRAMRNETIQLQATANCPPGVNGQVDWFISINYGPFTAYQANTTSISYNAAFVNTTFVSFRAVLNCGGVLYSHTYPVTFQGPPPPKPRPCPVPYPYPVEELTISPANNYLVHVNQISTDVTYAAFTLPFVPENLLVSDFLGRSTLYRFEPTDKSLKQFQVKILSPLPDGLLIFSFYSGSDIQSFSIYNHE